MSTSLVVAAIVAPTLTLVSLSGAKFFGRWFGRALKASMEDVVRDIVKPHLDDLSGALAQMRTDNARDHAEVSARLNALEARVALVEARLTPTAAVEG